MNARRLIVGVKCVLLCLVFPIAAAGQTTKTELAGNSLSQYPFFEYVRAFNVNAPVKIAIDPTRFPAIAGDTCDIYVVNHKSASDWSSNPALVDVTPGGALTQTFSATNIQANTFEVAAASTLNANAGTGLGVAYDVVLDRDQNGSLSAGDFIDGLGGEAGFYVVHDTTAAGPQAVTEVVYTIASAVATTFGIPATLRGQDLYYPTNIASMGKRPVVIIGHGRGHNFQWYDHIGRHLASYGYIVMSHDNDVEAGVVACSTTTLGHTDAFIDQVQAGAIAGGALVGHLDTKRIVWIGHSRGGEGVVIAYDRLFDGTFTPVNFVRQDVRLVSSMLPTDFEKTNVANPHDANYHLWSAAGDSDVSGEADCDQCQTFHLVDRATAYRQSTVVQGTGHGWFHDQDSAPDAFIGPCPLDEPLTHLIQLGYFLPLIKHYVDGNIPALDFLTRQYESFRPIGVPTANPCIVVTNEYHNGSAIGNLIIDDYQTQFGTGTSSSGGTVTFDVENLLEGRLDDNNFDFAFSVSDPFNGAVQASATDSTRGVVFDWTDVDRFYEWQIPLGMNDFTRFLYLSFRGAQGTRHPNTTAALADLTFAVTLRDGTGATSTINIAAYGGGLEEPYQRDSGWYNEMESIHMRTTDFLNNGTAINLSNIVAVRFNFGPTFGSSRGRIVVDDLKLTNQLTPFTFSILQPTTALPAYAGTSMAGNRVLVRLVGGGELDLSQGNLTISVGGTALISDQIATPATQVGGETWVIIAPGPKPDGCYDLTVSLTTPAGVSAAQPQSICYADDESRLFDRVLAIDQTNSMHFDGTTGLFSTAKMEAARAAAKFFVNLSNAGDQIGVISFQRRDQDGNGTVVDPDELAEPKFNLILAGEGGTDQRPAARTAVDGVSPDTTPGFTGPETSPGAGMVEARVMLDARGIAGHERHIVLLTDGLENYAPRWNASGAGGPLRPVFDALDIRIDTVGVGGDADDALLQDISAVTGGQSINLNEGSGSFFLLSRLSDWYKSVDEDVRGEQRFFYAEGFPKTIRDDQRLAGTFKVEPNLDWMTVAFHTNLDNAGTVTLFAPGSSIPVTATPPMVTVKTDPKHSVYRLRTPPPGEWTYVITNANTRAEFFAVASAPTSVTARLGPNQLERRPSGDYLMPLRVWIADKQSIRNATVSGYVRKPDGVKVPVTLVDNGTSLDGKVNDGIYGLGFVATLPGAHFVNLTATGISNSGEPFERYLTTAFILPGQPKRPVQPGEDGKPGDEPINPGGKCNCDAETKYSLSVFGGATFPHGSFNTIANPSYSLGIRPAFHFPAFGGKASLGLYVGRDNFSNPLPGGDFHLTHVSPEFEFEATKFCPRPTFHIGAGAYRDEASNTKFGFNVGAGLSVCINRRISFVPRYDFRSVNGLNRNYSTLQFGLRFNF